MLPREPGQTAAVKPKTTVVATTAKATAPQTITIGKTTFIKSSTGKITTVNTAIVPKKTTAATTEEVIQQTIPTTPSAVTPDFVSPLANQQTGFYGELVSPTGLGTQPVQPEATPPVTPSMNPEQFYDVLLTQQTSLTEFQTKAKEIELQILIDPLARLEGKTRTESFILLGRESQKAGQQVSELESLKNVVLHEWHPETKITPKTEGGYDVIFPYAGAEYFGSYSKIVSEHPELPALRAVTSPYLNIDLALAGPEQRMDIMVGYLHGMKGSPTGGPDLMRGLETIANSAFVQIAGMELLSVGVGSGLGYASGRLIGKGAVSSAKILGYGTAAVGGALTIPAALDIKTTFESGDIALGVGKAAMFGLLVGSAIEGGSIGSKTSYLKGLEKGTEIRFKNMLETGDIGIEEYDMGISALRSRQVLLKDTEFKGLMETAPRKPLEWEKIRSLETQPEAVKEFLPRQYLYENQKAEIGGGFPTGKKSTSDIDAYFKASEVPQYKYNIEQLGGNAKEFTDIHRLQRPGELANEWAYKQQPDYYEGYRLFKTGEQFERLSGSSLSPAHEGRLKDIGESLRLIEEDIIAGRSVSPELQTKIGSFQKSYSDLELLGKENPFIKTKLESEKLYGEGFNFREWLWEEKIKLTEKYKPESMFESRFKKVYGEETKPEMVFEERNIIDDSYLPPSIGGSLSMSLKMSSKIPFISLSPSEESSIISSVFGEPIGSLDKLSSGSRAQFSEVLPASISLIDTSDLPQFESVTPSSSIRSIIISDSILPASKPLSYTPNYDIPSIASGIDLPSESFYDISVVPSMELPSEQFYDVPSKGSPSEQYYDVPSIVPSMELSTTSFYEPPYVPSKTPYYPKSKIPKSGFDIPDLDLTGFDEFGGSFISIFGRTRKQKTGSLKKAFAGIGKL